MIFPGVLWPNPARKLFEPAEQEQLQRGSVSFDRIFGLGRRVGRSRSASHHRVDAEPPRAVEKHEEEEPGVNHRHFAPVDDWEKRTAGVSHEIRDGHHATGQERGGARQQSNGDQETANEFDPSADRRQHVRRAGRLARLRKPTEKFLRAVTEEQQPNNQTHEAINRICEAIQRVHQRRLFPVVVPVKALLPALPLPLPLPLRSSQKSGKRTEEAGIQRGAEALAPSAEL